MKSDLKEKLRKLTAKKAAIERDYADLIKTDEEYRKLNYQQQELLKADWDKYYQSVRQTKAYQRFSVMRRIWKGKKTDKLRAFAKKAREQLEKQDWELVKPALMDPVSLNNNQMLNHYKSLCKQLTEMQKEGSDYAVFSL